MKYAMYLRKSRADLDAENRGEGETLSRHKKMLFELAGKTGITISDIFEEVVSGDSIEGRPQIQALLRAIEKRAYTGVFCMDIDRLARGDTIDQGVIARAFRLSGTRIITPKKTYDPNSEFDEEYFEFELFMARREFKIIGRRIQRGRIESAKEGRFIGSVPPYGYDKIKIKNGKGYTLEPDPREARIVQLIFEMYLNGSGKALIAKNLDALGIKSVKGGPWSSSTVVNILKNPVYIGKVRWGYRKYAKELAGGNIVRHREKNEDCIYVDGLHPPLVSEEDFNRVQQLLVKRSAVPVRTELPLKNPLSGLIYCGKCGSVMTRLGENGRRGAALKCSNRYCDTVSSRLSLVESAVLDFLREWTGTYKINAGQCTVRSPLSTYDIRTNRLGDLMAELETVTRQIGKTYDLLERGIYTDDVFKERKTELDAKKAALRQMIAETENDIERYRKKLSLYEKLVLSPEDIPAVYLGTDDITEKNRLLKTVISRIVYTKNSRGTRGRPSEFRLRIEPFIK